VRGKRSKMNGHDGYPEVEIRVPNIMKRVMRRHDFRSDQGMRRRPYRE
jgi:hypothetical protein